MGASTNLKNKPRRFSNTAEIARNPNTAKYAKSKSGIAISIFPLQIRAPNCANDDIAPTISTAIAFRISAIKEGSPKPAKPSPTAMPAPLTNTGE